MSLLDRRDLDEPLARTLHADGRVDLAALRAGLEAARASGDPRATLGRWLIARGLVAAGEVEARLAALAGAPAPPASGLVGSHDTVAAGHAPPPSGGVARPLVAGARLAGHVIESRLGQGGMGAVYLARHEETGARRAIKTIPRAGDAELTQRFVREGEAMARVDGHPNVARVFAAGVEGPHLFLVLEHVEGGDLERRLREEGPQEPLAAARLALVLARALAHLHARGVLHRDLKPANVLLAADGTPKLADFGVARVADAQALTLTGGILGSPAYMAPEQAGDAKAVDARADVWGLGAVLYALLTGGPPFGRDGGGAAQVLRQVLSYAPEPPSAHAPAVPRALDALVLRCLEKEPAQRFGSAGELAAALDAFVRGGGRGAPGLRAAALAAPVLLGVVVAVAWSARRPAPDAAQPAAIDSRAAIPSPAERLARQRRDQLLDACEAMLQGGGRVERDRLAECARLVGADLDAARPEKVERIQAWTRAHEGELAGVLAEPTPTCRQRLEAVDAVLRAPPSIDAPPALEALLVAALPRWLARPDASDAATDAVCEAEVLRARALGHRIRPPDALAAWINERTVLRGAGQPIALLRVALWADARGLAGKSTDYVVLPRDVEHRVLDARRLEEEPGSQALALLCVNALMDQAAQLEAVAPAAERAERWALAVAAGRVAAGPPPTELGPRARLRAQLELIEALAGAGRSRPRSPEQLALARELVATAEAARAGGLPLGAHELFDVAMREANALRALDRTPDAVARWEAALVEHRRQLADPSERDHALQGLDYAAVFFRDLGDAERALAIANEASAAAETEGQRRRATTMLLSLRVQLPALRDRIPPLAGVDEARVLAWLPVRRDAGVQLAPPDPFEHDSAGAMQFAHWSLRDALKLDDRPIARVIFRRARETIGPEVFADLPLSAWILEPEGR